MYTGPDTTKFHPHTLQALYLLIPHAGRKQSCAYVNSSHTHKTSFSRYLYAIGQSEYNSKCTAIYSTISCVGTGVCPLPISPLLFPKIIFRLTLTHLEIFAPKCCAYYCRLQPSDSPTPLFFQFHYHNKLINHEFCHYTTSQTAQQRDTS
jgi:hypothetical protein